MAEELDQIEDPAVRTPLLHWIVPEYTKHDHGRHWYIGLLIVSLLCLFFAWWSVNYIFAIIVVLVAIVLVVRHNQEPLTMPAAIYDDGVAIHGTFYPYRDLHKFWIIFEPEDNVKTLYFSFRNQWWPRMPVALMGENPVEVRRVLLQFLEEDLARESEPTTDYIARKLGL